MSNKSTLEKFFDESNQNRITSLESQLEEKNREIDALRKLIKDDKRIHESYELEIAELKKQQEWIRSEAIKVFNSEIIRVESEKTELRQVLKDLYIISYDLMSHCHNRNKIDFDDDTIEGVKLFNESIEKARKLIGE